MANTEIRKTLQYVREAENYVTTALDSELPATERALLNDLARTLRDLDNQLVLEDLNAEAAKLEQTAQQMSRLNQETQANLKHIEKLAESIDKVAKAVDGLVKIFGIVVKAGLI